MKTFATLRVISCTILFRLFTDVSRTQFPRTMLVLGPGTTHLVTAAILWPRYRHIGSCVDTYRVKVTHSWLPGNMSHMTKLGSLAARVKYGYPSTGSIVKFLFASLLKFLPRGNKYFILNRYNFRGVYSTDRSKAVVPVLVLLFVALWFILRGDLFYVLPCVILFLCFSVLLALRLPRLGKRELIFVLLVRLFDLCLFGFIGFLFLLMSGKGCGLRLWHSLDFSLTLFSVCRKTNGIFFVKKVEYPPNEFSPVK